jgi:hypothetical protein
MTKPTLVAVLKTKDLGEIVQECEIPLEHFPDMIELRGQIETPPNGFMRQFFRIGITNGRAFYREGSSYCVSP